jgi:tetratricopeptide (TPR) repeat protein
MLLPLAILPTVLVLPLPAQQPLTPEQAAGIMLDTARRAHNEGKHDFAAERFRDFLKQYGNHKEAPAAQYGLGLCLLEKPQRDFAGAIAALQTVVGVGDFPDRALAFHYLGTAQRGLGYQALEQAAAKPNEAANFRNQAAQYFDQASKSFASAADVFAARLQVQPGPAATSDLPLAEWRARSRCDQCEMLLRLEKYKEGADLATAVLADKTHEQSRFRPLALYHLGYANFALKEYLGAGKALSQLAPFQQEFGVHARYLLARTHHLADERPEALVQYKGLLADFDLRKKAAEESLKNAGALSADQRAQAETLARGPLPEYIQRSRFYAALLAAEEGRFSDALEAFKPVVDQQPRTPLNDEAQLRQGYCQLQLRRFAESQQLLQPLHNHSQISDRALWWTGRALAGAADPNNASNYEQALRSAADVLNRAADRAGQLAPSDPEAKIRRGDILLEWGDTLQMAKRHKEAAETYQKALNENNNPDRAEETMQRLAAALHLSAQFQPSDDVCRRFEQTWPKSTLLPAVLFRAAENARLVALAAVADPNLRTRRPEVDRLFEEAVTRYQRLLKQFPEFAYVHLARFGLASAHYQLRRYPEAITVLDGIPPPDRVGELVTVPYLLADCHLRLLPAETDDALQAAQLIERAQAAAKLLEAFVAQQPQHPVTPDALLKLGYCYERIGMLLADANEQKKMVAKARELFERILQQYGNSTAVPGAVLERAKCLLQLGDFGGARNELGRFQSDPLKNSPVAPLALMRLASLLRSENKAAEAVNLMNQCRSWYESACQNDPERSDWVPLLQLEHAVAVKESGKVVEARGLFETIAKQFANRPEAANALWRIGQCRREELAAVLATARAAMVKPGVKPEEIAAANKTIDDGVAAFRQTAEYFKAEAARLAQSAAGSPAHLRMLYESAWCLRTVAEAEVTAARQKLQKAALDKAVAKWRTAFPNQPAPALTPPDVSLNAVPLQPTEQAVRDQYRALLALARDVPLAARARLELAEVHAQRGEHDAALEALAGALESNPPQELAERIRLRLAASLLAKQSTKPALDQIQTVLQNQASPVLAQARFLAGEAHLQAKDWNNAINQLNVFRDQDPYRNAPDLADRALLRLGYAFAQANRWDESRQAQEALVQRFPQSPWLYEARFGVGWAWQNQNQHDNACNAYAEVTRGTAAEVAARAQLQIGLCRLAQRRFPDAARELLVVAYAYDYPELAAAALCEAGQAYAELQQPAEAAKLWEAVVRDHGSGKWVEAARQRLGTIKK